MTASISYTHIYFLQSLRDEVQALSAAVASETVRDNANDRAIFALIDKIAKWQHYTNKYATIVLRNIKNHAARLLDPNAPAHPLEKFGIPLPDTPDGDKSVWAKRFFYIYDLNLVIPTMDLAHLKELKDVVEKWNNEVTYESSCMQYTLNKLQTRPVRQQPSLVQDDDFMQKLNNMFGDPSTAPRVYGDDDTTMDIALQHENDQDEDFVAALAMMKMNTSRNEEGELLTWLNAYEQANGPMTPY